MNQNSQVGKNAPINVHHHSMSATFNVNLEFKSNTEINQQVSIQAFRVLKSGDKSSPYNI